MSVNLSSLRIIIEESDDLSGEENMMIFEICRKTRLIQSKYSIFCNQISEIEEETNTEASLEEREENHWSINSVIFNKDYWPYNCKNENIRFLFAEEALRIINSIKLSDGKFSSESRYSIPRSRFVDYNITNQMDIKINRKSFERIMHLVLSLKCNLNAHFSDTDTDDPYQPQPFYLCGEVEKYIKIEGEIFGDHLNRGNDPERPLEWEIDSLLNIPNQVNQHLNSSTGMVYQVAEVFREDNTELSNSNTCVNMSGESFNANSRENHMLDDNVSDNYHSNYSHTNASISATEINPSISNSLNDSRSNYTGTSSHSSSSSYIPIPHDEEISRRLGVINFNDHRVSGVKRSFGVAEETLSEQPLTSLSLTHVEFDPKDPFSYAFAYVTLSPLIIVISYISTIISRRELMMINMFLGQLTCEILNTGLKKWIKEKRPSDKIGVGYGMPSSHAQFIAYFTIFSCIYLCYKITFRNNLWKLPLTFGLIIFSFLVSYSRIYLHYHTTKQVIVGNIFGGAFAIFWYLLIEKIIRPLGIFKTIIYSPIAKYFYLKDNSSAKDIIRIEYMNWLALNEVKEE
ncbi:18439_t:CDS:2 [Funneliformis geosporum]|nr:18439_t:CDS:2 [Funneliformis geosporum]